MMVLRGSLCETGRPPRLRRRFAECSMRPLRAGKRELMPSASVGTPRSLLSYGSMKKRSGAVGETADRRERGTERPRASELEPFFVFIEPCTPVYAGRDCVLK